jgi:hypothetical protein
MNAEPLQVPRFSLAERNQRWRREGLDVIVAPSTTTARDGRYLSGIEGNGSDPERRPTDQSVARKWLWMKASVP